MIAVLIYCPGCRTRYRVNEGGADPAPHCPECGTELPPKAPWWVGAVISACGLAVVLLIVWVSVRDQGERWDEPTPPDWWDDDLVAGLTYKKFLALREGMSRAEASALLGEPTRTYHGDGGEVCEWRGVRRAIAARFTDGALTAKWVARWPWPWP
jgi:hypothetical protein